MFGRDQHCYPHQASACMYSSYAGAHNKPGDIIVCLYSIEGIGQEEDKFLELLCRSIGSFMLGMVLEYCLAQVCTGYQSSGLAVIVAKALREDVPRQIFVGLYTFWTEHRMKKVLNKSVE